MLDGLEGGFWNDWGDFVILVGAVVVVLILAVLAYRAWRDHLSARSGAQRDAGTARLVEELAAATRAASTQSERNAEAIAALEKRVGAIEVLLRQVE